MDIDLRTPGDGVSRATVDITIVFVNCLRTPGRRRLAGVERGARVSQIVLGPAFWKRKRPTRNQAPPPTLPNVDVYGILFAIVAVVFVIYPLAQWALGL